MSEAYCPCCRNMTEPKETFSSSEYICEQCGTILEDSPILDPGTTEVLDFARASNHWSYTLNTSENSWTALNYLSKEESDLGRKYRRNLVQKTSVLAANTVASIESVCAKLGLDDNMKTRIKEKWYEIRGPAGLKDIHVKKSVAPLLGIACIYWICHWEGSRIEKSRLARISEVPLTDLLGAINKIQKLIGSPISPEEQQEAATSSKPDPADRLKIALSNITARIDKFHPFCLEEVTLLVNNLIRLEIVPIEAAEALVSVSVFFLSKKFKKEKRLLECSMEIFCKKNSLEFRCYSNSLESYLRLAITNLGCFSFGKLLVFDEVITKVRDLDVALQSVAATDLPPTIKKFSLF